MGGGMFKNAFDIFLNLLEVDVIFLVCMNQDLQPFVHHLFLSALSVNIKEVSSATGKGNVASL